MTSKKPTEVNVLDKSNRRRFIRSTTAALLASSAVSLSSSALAADCDQATSSDQDAGEEADPKGCEQRENIISKNLPLRQSSPNVKTIKAWD